MPDRQKRAERREKHAQEVEASQAALRASIAETQRLVDASEAMLKRHRREDEDAEEADSASAPDANTNRPLSA